MIMCALVELIQHTRAPPWGGGGGGKGEREGKGGREGKGEREGRGETVTALAMHSQTTKWTEEVSDVIRCHLLWERHQEHMLPRHWSCDGV